jgi:hypothetical protein
MYALPLGFPVFFVAGAGQGTLSRVGNITLTFPGIPLFLPGRWGTIYITKGLGSMYTLPALRGLPPVLRGGRRG